MKIAVTGANGQIGSVILRCLAEFEGFEAVGICRNRVGETVAASCGCEIRIGHISDPSSARELLSDCDVIVNCAFAVGLPGKSRHENELIVDSLALLGEKQVVHFSSTAVYGQCIDSRNSRFERPRPDTSYGHLKLALERRIGRTHSSSGGKCYIFRLGHVYGSNQWLSKQILSLAQEPDFLLPFDGDRSSNAIHVERLAGVIVRLVADPQPPGIYNLTDLPQRSWRELFDWHTQTLNLKGVRGLEATLSEALRASFLRQAGRRGVLESIATMVRLAAAGGLQVFLQEGPLRVLGNRALALLPSHVEDWVKGVYVTAAARRQIAELNERVGLKALPWHFSDGMPGPYLEIPQDIPDIEGRPDWLEKQLRSWYFVGLEAPENAMPFKGKGKR